MRTALQLQTGFLASKNIYGLLLFVFVSLTWPFALFHLLLYVRSKVLKEFVSSRPPSGQRQNNIRR
jgi:hypothetical protein